MSLCLQLRIVGCTKNLSVTRMRRNFALDVRRFVHFKIPSGLTDVISTTLRTFSVVDDMRSLTVNSRYSGLARDFV